MQTGENKNNEYSSNLNLTYKWFEDCFKPILTDSVNEFWGENSDLKLISLSENTNLLTKGEEYFVTQVRLNKELSVFLRLSKTFVRNILDYVLGSSGRVFDISKLTDLEVKILTGFNNFLFKGFSGFIKNEEDLNKINYDFDEYNLVFIVQDRNETIGKIALKIPVAAINPEVITPPEMPYLDIDDFLNTRVSVNLYAGYSKIKLSDLKNLEKDDIVLLENSKSSKMILKFDNKKIEFGVVPNPAIMTDYDIDDNNTNSEGGFNMGNDYNMWDTIQVEIGAEFEKVKLSLGELKQISEGLIVDIGSVYDNKIDLKVDEKIVASGELVIINDRYGVKINEVHAEEKNTATVEELPVNDGYEEDEYVEEPEQEQEQEFEPQYEEEMQMQEQEPEVDEEDFDYSEFDVDEEDI